MSGVVKKKYCVDGVWRESQTKTWMPVTDSSTGEVIAEVPCCTAQEVESAIASAQAAFPAWSQKSLSARTQMLFKWRMVLMEHLEELTLLCSKELGKTPVQVNEAAGFVVNRILIPMINEAAFIKMEGVSNIAGIDAAMKLGANHPMGPLELGDFIGLDICLAIMDVLYNETGDGKYRACPLIRKMVRGGNLGVKSGKGFYVYNADRTKTAVDEL